MRTLLFVALAGLALQPLAQGGEEADAIVGTWVTGGGKSRVEITKARDRYYGKITWLKEPKYPAEDHEAGKEKRDRENPDQSKRERPILGLGLLNGFEYEGKNTWSKGTIYDPENGKTYKCKMTLRNPKTLHVRGYVGISLIGRTTVWHRYEGSKEEKNDKGAGKEAPGREGKGDRLGKGDKAGKGKGSGKKE
ncbi:MAG TPA: DUF2147 domain-containing protein [Candidatus Hydrogenedentes bacterium]|nr:DUF2147 domain-containing protein [Candidatus Hydrogenedentota bacterium]